MVPGVSRSHWSEGLKEGSSQFVHQKECDSPAPNPNNLTGIRVILHSLNHSKLFYIPPRDSLGLSKLLENSKVIPRVNVRGLKTAGEFPGPGRIMVG